MCLEMKVGAHLELSEEAWVLETQRRAAEATNPVALENRCTGVTSRKSIEYCTQILGMSQREHQMPHQNQLDPARVQVLLK